MLRARMDESSILSTRSMPAAVRGIRAATKRARSASLHSASHKKQTRRQPLQKRQKQLRRHESRCSGLLSAQHQDRRAPTADTASRLSLLRRQRVRCTEDEHERV